MIPSNILEILYIVLIIILVYLFIKIITSNTICVTSELDKKKYLVQNMIDKEEASYVLSIINKKINVFKKYLKNNINKYPNQKKYIEQFCKRIEGLILQENAPNGKYTSYTLNKGDKMALCLRSKINNKLHDINLIMYVVLHELAHIACPEKDHTELFKEIFIFFQKIAIEIGIYKRENYNINPHEYCGLVINENLLIYTPEDLK